jgi:general secretion pathway protein A
MARSMYREFFGFKEKPFSITPNPRFIFLSKNHKEVFAHLLYGIRSHCGFIEVTGEVGTGKTTVLRTLLSQLGDDAYRLAFIFNPSLSAPELLRSIHHEFGIPCAGATIDEMLSALNFFLLQENTAGRTVVLVIDEAQNLEPGVLEQIRLLSNLETETDKLIQIVLVGQPELEKKLSRPELRQLNQRITVRYHLRSMDFEDARAYIRHRLEVAGGKGTLFTPGAVKKIFRYSGGLPRLINIVCDRALLSAYADDAREVSVGTVSAAIRELRRQSPKNTGLRRLAAVLGCLLLAIPFLGDTLAAVPRSIAVFVSLAVPVLGGYLALLPEAPSPSSSPPAVVAAAVPVAESSPESHSPLDADLLCRKLAEIDEQTVSARAFNALAALWKVETEPVESGLDVPFGLQKACDSRSLRLSGFRGTLEELVQLDTPALLQISLPGESGHRYLALTGVEGGRARIAPAPEEGEWLELESLRRLWGERAYLVWKNYRDLPSKTFPGDAGEEISRLQGLLRAAGVYERQASGRYDAATIEAVKQFQAERGLIADGKVGPQTLIALYQEVAEESSPTLGAPRPGGEE